MEIFDFLTLRLEFFGRVESDVCLAGIEQLLHILAIDVAAFALLVRSESAAFSHTLINANAQPLKGFIDICFGTGHKSIRVGVFYTENHRAAMLARKEVVIQRRTHTANV